MDTPTHIAELSCLLTERGIIVTDVMPFCLLNPNHTGHALGNMLRDVTTDDIAEAFGISRHELMRERASAPTLEDAVGALMGRNHADSGLSWLVRFYHPTSRGGYSTRLVFAPTMCATMQRMLYE